MNITHNNWPAIFLVVIICSCRTITRINYPTIRDPETYAGIHLNDNTNKFTISETDTGMYIHKLDYLSLSFVAPDEKYVVNFTLDTSKMLYEFEDSIYLVGGLVSFSKQYECLINYSLAKSVVRNTRFYKKENGDYSFYIPYDTADNIQVRTLYHINQLSPTLKGDSVLKGFQFETIDPNGNYFRFIGHSDPIFLIPFIVVAATAAYTSYKVYKASHNNKNSSTASSKDRKNDCYTKAKATASYQSRQIQYTIVTTNCD